MVQFSSDGEGSLTLTKVHSVSFHEYDDVCGERDRVEVSERGRVVDVFASATTSNQEISRSRFPQRVTAGHPLFDYLTAKHR